MREVEEPLLTGPRFARIRFSDDYAELGPDGDVASFRGPQGPEGPAGEEGPPGGEYPERSLIEGIEYQVRREVAPAFRMSEPRTRGFSPRYSNRAPATGTILSAQIGKAIRPPKRGSVKMGYQQLTQGDA